VTWIVQTQGVVGGALSAGRALISCFNRFKAVAETCPRIQLKMTPAKSTLTLLVAWACWVSRWRAVVARTASDARKRS
jgi:hypothetical protein